MLQDKIAKHTDEVMHQMFGTGLFVPLAKPTVADTLAMAIELEQSINKLTTRYADHRGNLDEAMRCISDIITNLEGHQKDMAEGKE